MTSNHLATLQALIIEPSKLLHVDFGRVLNGKVGVCCERYGEVTQQRTKFKIKPCIQRFFFVVLLLALLTGCSRPTFIGFQFNEIPIETRISHSQLKTNLEFQRDIFKSITLPESILKSLDMNAPIIISNYNLYPYSPVLYDSLDGHLPRVVDQNINGELIAYLSKQLLLKGYSLLESDEAYNSLDYNFDEFNTMINFEIKNFGLYYEVYNKDRFIRKGTCDVRFKVLNKDGLIKSLEDAKYVLSDTVLIDFIDEIEMGPKTLAYENFFEDPKLTQLSLPRLGGNKTGNHDWEFFQSTPETKSSISGLRFLLPDKKKTYAVYMVDYVEVRGLTAKLGREPNMVDVLSLKPTKLELKIDEIIGRSNPEYVSIIQLKDLEKFTSEKKAVVFYYKGRKLCAIRKNGDGSYSEIQ